tara:strand:+ start:176 stop:307 length:132 start_codon:yes stop_codon:yes gene_type:complete
MQSFSFLSFFSAASKFDEEIIIIKNKINNFSNVLTDLLPISPG